jgi:Flp pilus assembly protein TadG
MSRFHRVLRRFRQQQDGASTIDVVIVVPVVLALLFTAIDFGVVMLRQVFLDRSLDLAVRQVRLGNVPQNGLEGLRQQICNGSFVTPNCVAVTTIEMRPINPDTMFGLSDPAMCLNRAEQIAPVLEFNPGSANELMLIRVCMAADPFLWLTGFVYGMAGHPSGGYALVARAAFANEPR